MKRDEAIYSAIYEKIKEEPCGYEDIYRYVTQRTGKDINQASLRTRLTREINKGILERKNGRYFIKDENNVIQKDEHEMLKKYIEDILRITTEKEKELVQNPFETFTQIEDLLEAKEVYAFNKQLQNFLNSKLKEVMLK